MTNASAMLFPVRLLNLLIINIKVKATKIHSKLQINVFKK